MAGRIEDYALIGDMQTAALVCRDGTVDWLCLPRFDSHAIFAGLLGTEEHGFWRLGPAHASDARPPAADRRSYRGDSLILESEWDTPRGTVRVIDFMPPRDGAPQLIRIVEGVSGRVRMRSALRMRFSYGRVVPWVHKHEGRTVAVAGPDSVWFDTDCETYGKALTTYSDFTVGPGDRIAFTISWEPSHRRPPALPEPEQSLEATEEFWREWVEHCTYHGPYREAVIRSLITLKALTYAPTGGIVAAPTTSLPGCIGGERNWDHRYCWLRDSTLTLSCLLRSGYRDEATAWLNWLMRAIAGDPAHLQTVYGVGGQRLLHETEAPWLDGYEGSQPVRFGNSAEHQFQLDVYGEVLDTLCLSLRAGIPMPARVWSLVEALMGHLLLHWREPDQGLWQVRGPRRQFVHSKVMAWVAADRALRMGELLGRNGSSDRWRELRDEVHREVCREGWDPRQESFVQSYGSSVLDAAALQIPRLGFLPPRDRRVQGTVRALRRLDHGGFVHRYGPGEHGVREVDGIPGSEGTFVACTLWYADALAATGHRAQAREVFERALAIRNDVGLLAEQWDPDTGRQLGNAPQAFSHVALVETAFALSSDPSAGRRDPSAHRVPRRHRASA